jgi:predicted nucleic acid-binding protein
MSSIVVDTSVAIKWFVAEPLRKQAIDLGRSGAKLIAPDLVILEVGNVVWTKVRMGQMLQAQAEFVAGVIPKYFAALVPSADISVMAFQIASDLDHPVYDCAYLAVAVRFSATLITADRRLLTKAANSPYDHLVRDLAQPLS